MAAAAIVRVRGLPYSATADDVIDFFKDVGIKGGKRGISFPQGPNGRSNGEAFVEIENDEDVEKAMTHHKEHMGRRYIEVFRSDEGEMKRSMGWQPDRNKKEYVARLRGLPYDTEKRDIYSFFNDLQIAPNGIGLLVDHLGRCTGDAYVQFTSAEMLARAKEKHLEKIGRRYIEIFDATGMEANMAIRKQLEINQDRNGGGGPIMGHRDRGFYGGPPPPGPPGPYRGPAGDGYGYNGGRGGPRPGPYSRPYGPPSHSYDQPGPPSPRGGGGYAQPAPPHQGSFNGPFGNFTDPRNSSGHIVHMRGLPFQATQEEIGAFFKPVQPINIIIHFNAQGRPTGEADAEFATIDEAKEAMKKDREKIGVRYIELFLESGGGRNGPPQSPGFGDRGGGDAQFRNYGPPFYGGGGAPPSAPGGNVSVGRYNGGGPPRSHYDAPGGGDYYGGAGDYYSAPPEDNRFADRDQRPREGYGGPMQPQPDRRPRPDDDGYDAHYDVHREHEGYYW